MDIQIKAVIYICVTVIVITILYFIYISRLQARECSLMNSLYPSIDGHMIAINSNDPDCSGNLFDYYVKTAYNCCSGGSYKNDFVSICNLKAVIKQGVRCLDFEIYSVNDNPVVAASTDPSYFIKETFNAIQFNDVLSTLQMYAFSGGSCPNPTDPIIIHLRMKSTNQTMFTNMANLFSNYDSIMLGKEYSFEQEGTNLGAVPLLSLQNKVIVIIDRINNSFLENAALLEYINLTSNSIFARAYRYNNVKNNPDINELTAYNKRGMTIVLPDNGSNPPNPSGYLCRAAGCQMVAMRFQYVDDYLMENAMFFDTAKYAFVLKPQILRYIPVTIPTPTAQNPDYSYATRDVSSDYYSMSV